MESGALLSCEVSLLSSPSIQVDGAMPQEVNRFLRMALMCLLRLIAIAFSAPVGRSRHAKPRLQLTWHSAVRSSRLGHRSTRSW
jgi:hypothetical protein